MTDTEKGKDLTNAVDKRTWLAERGLAKAGTRGKFSNDAKAALLEAEKNGIVFIDKKAIANVTTVIKFDGDKRIEERRQVDPFAPHAPATRTGMLEFVGPRNKKLQVNATEACIVCRYSFGWCKCNVPQFRYWKSGEVFSLAARVN